MRRARALLLAIPCLIGCGSDRGSSRPESPSTIPVGAVATCAGAIFTADEIARVAADSHTTPARALERLATDARFAKAARDRGAESSFGTSVAIRAALARALLHQIRNNGAPPFSAEEIETVRHDHREDLDRPEAFRVVHAVARFSATDPPEVREKAETLARTIADATSGSHGAADFTARANAVPRAGIEVVVESLPAFDMRGTALDGSTALDSAFVAGTVGLTQPDQQSPPVTSSFGVHVIHLLERLPPKHASDDEIAALAREELGSNRSRIELTKLLADARAHSPIAIERSADDALHLLDVVRR